MENKTPPNVPKYINELMQPTPSSIAKLLAAWSGLTSETQILILSKLDEIDVTYYLVPQIMKVITKALDSDNAYVRYLAARKFINFDSYSLDDEGTLKERIENDPVPLVRYSLLENSDGIGDDSLEDADSFFALPQEARLAKVRLLSGIGDGKSIAELLSQAVDKHLKDGIVSEVELYEILADYLIKPEFQEKYSDARVSYDGYGEYLKGKDIESLWKLVPKLPEGISRILIENLPEASGLNTGIPEHVIGAMTDNQLATLLYREDIGLRELRKKLFWEAGKERDNSKTAAVCSNFQLEYDEFAKILAKPPKERVYILKKLGMMASALSLCFYAAIHDALCASDVSPLGGDFENAIYARDALKGRIKELKGVKGELREEELTELRLYRLANSAVPWDSKEKGYAPSGELKFLSEEIVPGDTWATFVAFSEAWSKIFSRAKVLDKHLPRIYEIDEDWEPEETDVDADPAIDTELVKSIDEKLTEIQQAINLTDNQGNEEMLEDLEQISEHATEQNANIQQEAAGLRSELKALKSVLNRQRLLMYIIIGLMIWLLFTLH